MDCWQVILSFCEFEVLETIYIYGKKKIKLIFFDRHFLQAVVKREQILPQLLTQPIVSFFQCCQLVRLDQTIGSREDLLAIAKRINVSEILIYQLCCLNGRIDDAIKILGYGDNEDKLQVMIELMLMTYRGRISNMIDLFAPGLETEWNACIALSFIRSFFKYGATRKDVDHFMAKDIELFPDPEYAVNTALGPAFLPSVTHN